MEVVYEKKLVVGTKHYPDACSALLDYIEAEMNFGIELVFDPSNKFDKNAVQVVAYVIRKSLFGSKKSSGQIGFIPKDTAKTMASFRKNKGANYSAKLRKAEYVGVPHEFEILIDIYSDV